MIDVARAESPAAADAAGDLLASLEHAPGIWMGCDIEAEDQYRKASIACAVPALRFCLDGPDLLVTPMGGAGHGLLGPVRALAAFEEMDGSLRARMVSGAAVIDLLRRFLALFRPASPELALYGALSFDFYRLAGPDLLPDDGRRRLVLFFPQRVLESSATGARWIDFSFAGVAVDAAGRPAALAPVRIEGAGDEMAPGGHAQRVAEGIALLRKGDLYSLVLSQVFRRSVSVPAAGAFSALRRSNPYPGMFFCNLGGGEILFGASPDVQVRADARSVESSPVCGTVRRGGDPMEDAAQAFGLLASGKEAASLALCADSAAEELSAVCEPGTVGIRSRRRLHFFSTLMHTIDHLRGRRKPGLDGFDILLAHATPATVTGLPKMAAVRAIEALEPQWRGWYAGAVARIGSDGSVEAYTVLRAARVAGGVAEVRTGGNVLVDSDPAAEEAESRLKAQSLFRVLEAAADQAQPAREPAPAWPVAALESRDPFQRALWNAIAKAGGFPDAGGIVVLSAVPQDEPAADAPLLLIGDAATWRLRRDGAAMTRLDTPAYARPVEGRALAGGFLEGLGAIHAGWYATEALREDCLPADWRVAAVSVDGWVLAAQHRAKPICALLFRPDSMLSVRGDTGGAALRAAFAWLKPRAMFDQNPGKESR